MVTDDTIAAIATPPGRGGLAVLRVSGPDALPITGRVFCPSGGKNPEEMPGYTAAYGRVIHAGEQIDDGVLTVFRAPHSYTGEDVCEISCHGGDYLARRVLTALIEAGARPALPGEFTKRAFLGGKMDLTRAEAVIELIEAEGEQALRLARLARKGRAERMVDAVTDRLVGIAAALAAYADYPDEDLGETDPSELERRISDEMEALSALTKGYEAGQIVRRGVMTAIVGRPNVGKSSLMNRLFGRQRSIVTDIPGTTRDVVEAEALIEGVRFILADTAGLRESGDEVERIGVALSYERMVGADLIIYVLDAGEPLSEDDRQLIAGLAGRRAVVALNKSDRPLVLSLEDLPEFGGRTVLVSAHTGHGFPELQKAMADACGLMAGADSMLMANRRQLDCALRAYESLAETREAVRAGVTLDAVAALLEDAIAPLLELTGRQVNETVIAALFEKFCVGK